MSNAVVASLKSFFEKLLDAVLPKRSDFAIVEKLGPEDIAGLPKSSGVENCPWITTLFRYKDNRVRAIIWELKFKNNTRPVGAVASLLYEEILSLVSDILVFEADARFLLIPIPLSPLRRAERGYNQCEYICRAIVEHDASRVLLYAPQWLEKIRETPDNKKASRQERAQNLSGCFAADGRVAGTYVILIDDVVTTGSTLSEARQTLLSAGATNVLALAIAH